MENNLIYLIIYLLEGCILWQYCNTLFLPKHKTLQRLATLTLLYGFLTCIFTLHLLPINVLLMLIANVLFIRSMYESDWLVALFHASLTTSLMGLSELIVLSLVPNLAHNFNEAGDYTQRLLLLTVFSKLLYFLLLFLVSHLLNGRKEKLHLRELTLLMVVPLLSLWVVLTLLALCYAFTLTEMQYQMVLLSTLFLIAINLITWGIYRYLLDKNKQFTQLQLQMQKEAFITEYYDSLIKQNEGQQILIHDFKNHLQSLALLSQSKDCNRIDAYIQQLLQSETLQTTAKHCEHKLLNAILCQYQKRCAQEALDFHTDIRRDTAAFLSDEDLTSLFCNLLDNAVEGAHLYPHGYVEVSLSKQEHTDFLLLNIVNSCLKDPFDKKGQLTTTKPDARFHGFGIKSIQKIVARNRGEIQMYYKESDHTFHTIILFRKP